MSKFIVKFDDWDKKGNVYTYPNIPDKCNWYDCGLEPRNDSTLDLFGWYGFLFDMEIHGTKCIKIKAELLDFNEVNTQEVSDCYEWSAEVFGDGVVHIVAPLSQFNLYSSIPARWRFLRSLEINGQVQNLRAVREKSIYAYAHVLSKSENPDETIEYKLTVVNCTNDRQAVSFTQEKNGWEVLSVDITDMPMLLEPFEERECFVRVKMSERIAPGGFEKQRIHIIPNGNGADGQIIEFISTRYMEHPYISACDSEWENVKKKITEYEWAKKLADEYISNADSWIVPEAGDNNHGLFVSKEFEHCFNSALVWKLTGNIEYAKKSALFLVRLAQGYPLKHKACNQQLVHEGECFKYAARAYDLICDCGVLNDGNKKDICNTFRIFIDFLDWALSDGGISNWSLAENAGALYCAMALQDREKIERFTFGVGGVTEHIRAGVFADGWWCECTIGYNQMVAGLFSEITLALRPWGINLANYWVGANYSSKVHFRNQHMDGLSWDIYGENNRNYRCIEDLWDSLVAVANYRSISQGVNDSCEERFEGASMASFDSRYDIAYYLYRKPEYGAILTNSGDDCRRDLIHGEGELPECNSDVHRKSCYFDNGGIVILRTNTDDRDASEQIEIGVKYGTHGGAHGHYDRCALNAVSRYGKALYNPENVWYSYGTFMYKFFVQNSITHNMVTVDLKLQDPTEGRQSLFHSGKLFNASIVENCAKWSNPPYGGWRVRNEEPTFKERAWIEGRYVNIPENTPDYTSRTDFTEPIMQRRCTVLMDDYVVCFDYMKSENEHDFHCIYHLNGLQAVEGDIKKSEHREQLSNDYLSSAQFITDVDIYDTNGSEKLSFEYEYGEMEEHKASWLQHHFRSGHNIPGTIKTDLYYVDTDKAELVVGYDPEYYSVSKRLFYSVCADGKAVADGKFGAWILGRDHIDIDVRDKKKITLHTRTENGTIDHARTVDTVKTIFWGDPYFETADGKKVYLSDMNYTTENIDNGNGVGVDYEGGPVKIQTKSYEKAIPADEIDRDKEGIITVDISDIDAVRFVSDIGGDYPVGDENARRTFAAQKKHGKNARFISVLEPHQDKSVIEKIEFISYDEIVVHLKNGKSQRISISNFESGTDEKIEVSETFDNKICRYETNK